MAHEIFRRRSVVLVTSEALRDEVRGSFRHVPRHFADRRLLRGNLEDGRDAFEFVPRWISSQHLNDGAT